MAQSGNDAFHFGYVLIFRSQFLAQPGHRRLQKHGPGAGRQRQRRFVNGDVKLTVGVDNLDLLILQHASVLIPQRRQQNFVHQLFFGRMPIDIEKPREGTAGTVLQHIPPPKVGGMRDAHMVGNHVGNQSHLVSLERRGKSSERRLVADLRIEARLIGNVVAVDASGPRHEKRRGVDVGDTKFV